MDKLQKIQAEAKAYMDAGRLKKPKEFKAVLENYLKEVNDLQKEADKSIKKFVSGEKIDIHEVMIAAQEAHISFQLMLELRNKLLSAYQEVMRMPV